MELFVIIKEVMNYLILPFGAWLWGLHTSQQKADTRLAVLEANLASIKVSQGDFKQAHEREMNEIRDTYKAISTKLDSIEAFLRK